MVWGKDTPLPAILTVSEDRKEGPVNYRMSGEYIVVSPIPANLMLRYGSKYALLWPTHQIASPQRAVPAAAPSRIAAAPAQQPTQSQAAPQASPQSQPANHSVRLANMTSLYSDKLTDNQHDR